MKQIGRYEILRELGQGAMGVVYEAVDPLIGRQIAIKTIRLDALEGAGSHEELTRRLYREAQSAGILSHPGIITIHDIGEQGTVAYIVMEYVEGSNLEMVLASGIPQHSGMLLSILKQSAIALDYAHSKGIVHRDIKPSNIMICADGSVKVADFGVAKLSASSSMTQVGLVLGTPSYMSPEQAQGRAVDGRSDQFSLAVVAYRMLTRELPFQGETLTALLTRILLEDPQYDESGLHSCFHDVFKKALAKNPQARYSSCEEFVQDLENAWACSKADMPEIKIAPAPQEAASFKSTTHLPEMESGNEPAPPPVVPGEPFMAPAASMMQTSLSGVPQFQAPEPPAGSSAEIPAGTRPEAVEAAGIPARKMKSSRIPLLAGLAVVVLGIAVFLAVKMLQKTQHSVTDDSKNSAAVASNNAAQIPVTGEEKTADSLPSAPQAPSSQTPPDTAKPKMPAVSEAPVKPRSTRQPEVAAPASGVITWTGDLNKNALLIITDATANVGSVTGGLPGRPVTIEVDPDTVKVNEPPSESNQWKQIMLYSGKKKYSSITIRWKTKP